MKVRDAIRRLLDEGWYVVSQEGSHRQFKHPEKPGKVTVAGIRMRTFDRRHGKAYKSKQSGNKER